VERRPRTVGKARKVLGAMGVKAMPQRPMVINGDLGVMELVLELLARMIRARGLTWTRKTRFRQASRSKI